MNLKQPFKKFLLLIVILFIAHQKTDIKSEYTESSVNLRSVIISSYSFIHKDNLVNLDNSIFSLMVSECDKYKIPYPILFGVADKESGFRFIKNFEGSSAMGYMQITKSTFDDYYKKMGLTGGHTPENNIKVGAFYLYTMHENWKRRFKNDRTAWRWTLAEYAVGLGGMQVVDSTNTIRYRIPNQCIADINKVMRNYD